MTSANAVIVNRNIFPHQFHLSIRWKTAYANRLLITNIVSYSNTYIVPMGAFCGTPISFPERYMTSAISPLITDTFPNTSFHLSIRWEAAYANRYLIINTVLYSNTRICILRNIFAVYVCFLRKKIRELCRYSYC